MLVDLFARTVNEFKNDIDGIKESCSGRKVGWAASSYDLLHAGHILYLDEAKDHCDFLIAALQTDPTIDRPNKNKPVQSLLERYIQLNAVKYVDAIIIYDTEEMHKSLLHEIQPDFIFKGSDYKDKPIIEDDGTFEFCLIERNHNWSTSELRQRIKNS